MKRFKSKAERRYGTNLLLKGERNLGPKAPFRRKPYPPGMHGKKYGKFGKKLTEYGKQFAEKQKLKILYGISERQLKNYFQRADKSKNPTDIALLQSLEERFDNIVFRAGLADTRSQARQWIGHGHFSVNGKRVKKPSYNIEPQKIIELMTKSKNKEPFKNLSLKIKNYNPPNFIELDKAKMQIKLIKKPDIKDLETTIETSLVVGFYSK